MVVISDNRSFPTTNRRTTLQFVILEFEVFASCYANTQEALVFCLAFIKDENTLTQDRTRRWNIHLF